MQATIPTPLPEDSEDVNWALTTAQSLLARGDFNEALRWLRKATASAVAANQDTRAAELGRFAIAFERSLLAMAATQTDTGQRAVVAPGGEGAGPMSTTILSNEQRPPDSLDLDQPTYVESSRHPNYESPGAPSTIADGQRAALDSEITQVPFTMKAAGVTSDGNLDPNIARTMLASGQREVERGESDTVSGKVPSYRFDEADDERTLAMRAPPNIDEMVPEGVPPPRSQSASGTMQQGRAATRFRVAMLASPDGHDPRVMLLRSDAAAPAGSGVAMLIPASVQDAELIAHLLGETSEGERG